MGPVVRQDVDEVFVGQFEHALDAKGRIVLPASFRVSFDESGFLIKGPEGCLALLTPERFRDIAQTMASRSGEGDVRHRSAKDLLGQELLGCSPTNKDASRYPKTYALLPT